MNLLNLIFSRSGYGKTRYVDNIIKQRFESGKEDMVLLVPEQISFESERHMLSLVTPGGMNCIDVLSFTRLCERFFEKYGGRGKRCIDNIGKIAMMELGVKNVESSLVLFKRQAGGAAFYENLLDLSEQMKRFNVSSADFTAAAAGDNGILGRKLDELSLIFSSYENLLNNEFYDPLDNLTKMANMLGEHKYFSGKTVFLDSFNGFTAQQLSVIEKIIAQADDTYITLGFDGMPCESEGMPLFANVYKTSQTLKNIARGCGIKVAADVILTDSHRYKSKCLEHFEKNVFMQDSAVYEQSASDITVCRAQNVYDEAEYVAREIHRLVREQGYRYREIAVIARNIADYDGIIDSALERYGIPCFADIRRDVSATAVFKLVQYALCAVIGGFQTDDIVSMLKTSVTYIAEGDVSLMDNYTAVWRINGADWAEDFSGNPYGADAEFDDAAKQRLNRINELRRGIYGMLCELKKGLFGGNIKQICAAVYNFVIAAKADKQLIEFCNSLEADGYIQPAERERRSYDVLISLLDQLVMSLDKQEDISAARFYEIFCGAVRACDIGMLPQGLDEVAVGSAERMRPKAPRVTFIIGANDGVFPAVYRDGGLLSDAELQTLSGRGIELPFYNEERAVDELYLAYTASASASERLYVSYCAADMKGAPLMPSVLVDNILSVFPECGKADSEANGIAGVENTDGALGILADASADAADRAAVKKYFEECGRAEYESLSRAMQPYDYKIDGQNALKLYGGDIHTSASKADVFYKCKFYYFCKYGMKAEPIRAAEVDVLKRGSLVHYVLEQVINNYDYSDVLKLDDKQIREIVDGYKDEYLSALIRGRNMAARETYMIDRLVDMMTELVRRVCEELEQSKFDVYKTELAIGGDEVEPMRLKLPDGGSVVLSGKIDRVDIYEKNGVKYVRIIDYKTGGKKMRLADVLYGQNLQMLVYMLALKKSGGSIDEGIVPAAILYLPAKTADVSAERGASDAEIRDARLKEVKMNGIFMDDENVIDALEPSGAGVFTPVRVKKDGSLYSGSPVYTAEQFGMITRRIEKLLIQMGESLHNGETDADPIDGVDSCACDYCDYRSVCLRDSAAENRRIPPLKDSAVYEILRDEDNSAREDE